MSARWEAAFDLRGTRVRTPLEADSIARPRCARARSVQRAKRHARELRESDRIRRAIEGQVIVRFVTFGELLHRLAAWGQLDIARICVRA